MSFDAFIAIDWSGNKQPRYKGISVARCEPGRGGPSLTRSRSGQWTRTEIVEWLDHEISSGKRLLIGFDFAFGFPYEPKLGYLGGRARKIESIFALWDLIDGASCDDADFGCSGMVAAYSSLFWTTGPRPARWIERKRLAERACAGATETYPESLYKLLYSKQVGKASMTGIRVLNELRRRHPGRFSVWPFDKPDGSVAVEIYPTLFRKRATDIVKKIKDSQVLNDALQKLGSRAAEGVAGAISDHDGDALISAAGLREMAGRPEVWRAPPSVRREGWIFGVPFA